MACPCCLGVFRRALVRCPIDGEVLGHLGDDPMVGSTVAGKYDIEALVGEGSMGRVYRARHAYLSREFAVKVLYADLTADPTMRMRFAQEAEAASRLRHPNLVSVIDFGRTETGLLYMAMDYADGPSLAEVVEVQGPLGDSRALTIIQQIAEGLAHAHACGLIHRDLKPDNVVLCRRDDAEVALVLDFGLAISVDDESPSPRLTARGVVLGTPAYMAPEQIRQQPVDHRADLFALGMISYVMLAGAPPFDGNSIETAANIATKPMPPISERNPGVRVSAALESLVMRLLEKRPDDRPASAAAVLDALAGVRRVHRRPVLDLGTDAGASDLSIPIAQLHDLDDGGVEITFDDDDDPARLRGTGERRAAVYTIPDVELEIEVDEPFFCFESEDDPDAEAIFA
jgi:eukaryotic-like serine/threonine-protein kinase